MKRTIMALIIAFVTAALIATLATYLTANLLPLMDAFDIDLIHNPLTPVSLVFGSLIRPWSLAVASIYTPLVALIVAGFIAGLISKSYKRMGSVSVLAIVLFFLAYYLLSVAAGITDLSVMWSDAQRTAVDVGIAYFLLLVPGIIGALITTKRQ